MDASAALAEEAELAESRWRALAAATTDVLITVDAQHRITDINRVVPSLTVEAVIGHPIVDFVPPERKQQVRDVLERVFAGGEPMYYTALQTGPEPGGVFEVLVAPRRHGTKIVEAIYAARRVTELAEAHRALKQARREAETARAALLQAQLQRRRMSTLLVHDFNGPLSTILANAQFLQGAVAAPQAQDGLRDLIAAAERIQRMTENMLDVDRAEDGKLVPVPSPMDVRTVVETCARGARARAGASRHTVAVVFAPEVRSIVADEQLVRRVLENLIDNALKYAPPGSEVGISATLAGESLQLRVSDLGPGVPDAFKERIFETYVRLEPEIDRQARPGLGLSLTMCQVAVRAHGGRIWVEDHEPTGAVFCVELPVQPRR